MTTMRMLGAGGVQNVGTTARENRTHGPVDFSDLSQFQGKLSAGISFRCILHHASRQRVLEYLILRGCYPQCLSNDRGLKVLRDATYAGADKSGYPSPPFCRAQNQCPEN